MQSSSEIALPFLGNRQYLQGPTVFDAMRIGLPSTARLSFKVSRQITTDRLGIWHWSEGTTPVTDCPALLSWKANHACGIVGAIPLAPSVDPRRIPYDESLIVNRTVFTPRTATLTSASPYSFAATITSMLKALLLRVVPQSESGQWLFARLDCIQPPEEFLSTSVEIDETLCASTFVRAAVRLAHKPVGSLYFSWLAKK